MVPLLWVSKARKPGATLNPVFDIAGELHAMVTQYLAMFRKEHYKPRYAAFSIGMTISWLLALPSTSKARMLSWWIIRTTTRGK